MISLVSNIQGIVKKIFPISENVISSLFINKCTNKIKVISTLQLFYGNVSPYNSFKIQNHSGCLRKKGSLAKVI